MPREREAAEAREQLATEQARTVAAEAREQLATEQARTVAAQASATDAEASAADERSRRHALERRLDRRNDHERDQPRGLPERLISYITLAGLLLYGIAVFGYRVCYETIGVDPEEAGLSYAQIVTQAALGTTILVIAVILLLMLRFPLEQFLSTQEGQFFGFYIVVATVIVALSINGDGRISLIGIGVIVVISVPVAIWALHRSLGKGLMIAGVLLFLTSLIVTPIVIGSELGNEIKAGKTETPISLVGLLRVRVRLVAATWSDSPPEWANSSGLYYYLGEADGVILLYDTENCTVDRISMGGANGVALSTVPRSQAIAVLADQAASGRPVDCGT
jgi:hypothetical protein